MPRCFSKRNSRRAALLLMVAVCFVRADEKFSGLIKSQEWEKATQYAEASLTAGARDIEVWLGLGRAYDALGEQDKALSAYQSARKINPSDPRVYNGLGMHSFAAKDFETALKHFQKSYILDRTAKAAEGIALSAAELKNWDKAQDAAESAVKLDANVHDARVILRDIYLKSEKYDAAAEQLEVLVKQQPKNVKNWKDLALCYQKTNNEQGLARVDPKIVELDSKDIESRRRVAERAMKAKDDATAMRVLKELAILTPNDPKIFKNLYEISNKKKETRNAILYLKNYLALDSTSADSYKALGDLLYAQNDKEGALEAYSKSRSLNGDIKGIYKNYADIIIERGMDKEAVSVIPAAIAAGEAEFRHYKALGDIYREQENFQQAADIYQQALTIDAKSVEVLTSLARSQAKAGNVQGAILSYEQVVLVNQNASEEYKELGQLHEKAGKRENAINAYMRYLEKVPTDGPVAKKVGLYQHEQNNYPEAVKYLEMAKDGKLHDIEYLVALGESYYNQKNHGKAAELFAKAQAKNPPADVKKRILKPLAICYEKGGKSAEAARAYDQYVSVAGKDSDAAYLSAFLRENSDLPAAIEIYERNVQVYVKDHRNFLRLGLIYAKDKETLPKAESRLSTAAALQPTDASIWRNLAQVRGKLNDSAKELQAYQKLLELEPRDLEANRRVGSILLAQGELSKALTHLEIVHTSDPKDIKTILMLAEGYTRTKRPAKAMELLEKAKLLDPKNPDIRLKLIESAVAAGQKDKAESERGAMAQLDREIVAGDSKDVDSRIRLANYAYEKKDAKTAYETYGELAKLTPKDPEVFKRLYTLAMAKGDKPASVNHLRNYIELQPRDAEAHKNLGNLLYAQKKTDEALAAYREALKLNPEIRGFYKQYVDLVTSKNLRDETISAIKGAITAGEADAGMYITLGRIYQNSKQYASAIEMYKKALDAQPNNAGVLTSLAQSQAEAGDVKNAILSYEQVVLINSDAAEEHKALGQLLEKVEKRDKAMEAYKKFIAKVPTDYEVARKIGLYAHEQKNYQEAIKYMNMVTDKKLHNVAYLRALGESHYNLKNYAKAAENFALVWSKNPSSGVLAEVLKPLGESYEKLSKQQNAAEAYDAYVKLPGVSDPDASFKRAYLRENQDQATAIQIYTANTKSFPNDARNFLQLGLIYSEDKNKLTSAATMLSKASTLDSSNPTIWEKLGGVYGKSGDTQKELEAYQKLLTIKPNDLDANRRVGTLLIKNKQWTKGITNLEMVLTMAPKDVEVMQMLSEGYLQTNRPEKAAELLAQAKKLKGDDIAIRELLYRIYKETGNKAQAEAEVKELIAKSDDNKYRLAYASDLMSQNRYDEAMKIAREVKEKDPVNIEAFMLIGAVQKENGKLDEAIETYKMISFIDENHAPSLYERGDVYLRQKDLNRAKEYFERAIKTDGKFALGYLGLARVAKTKNDNGEYQKFLAKAKVLDPKHPQIAAEAQ